jgi:hypothetical protein
VSTRIAILCFVEIEAAILAIYCLDGRKYLYLFLKDNSNKYK